MDIYKINDMGQLIQGNPYVGRGIVLGRSADGSKAVSAYFIMGRSQNSRNRVFTLRDGALFTEPFDASKVEDPSLIIYAALRMLDNKLIVTNGDQTDTILEFLERGLPMEQALRTREFEPDGPNWTPRISGLLSPDGSYKLSILKSADPEGSACARQTFEYPALPGVGHFLHTYVCNGSPIPTFQGEPERVAIGGDMDAFTDELWASLDADNKISLFVRYTDLETRTFRQRILNKHQ